ncbi:putative methyltransferase domain-containing protein [Eutypa lata UCREL1]|uniref:Putative methyltransferase domain-containing protein n=1 Tax=Eutypa lata (strain UCR-EL1) TaxID=1287681 RepID=M7TZK5_EUTLA|nr:putative methyltransferase domain-containing protein [Eutypa lata UCREL1]
MDPMDTDPPEGTDVAPVAAHPAAAPVHYDYQSDAASMLTTPTLQIDNHSDRDSALGGMSNIDSAPPNVSFEICDAEDEWSFSQKFDFIHMRAIVTCFMDPKAVFRQAYDALEPGGYLELRDPIMPFQFLTPPAEDCALKEWGEKIIEAASRIGRHWTNAQYYSAWLQELGCVNIVETREHVGLNPWMKGGRNKQLAMLLGNDMSNGLESMSMALFTRVLGWEPERVHELLERVRQDMADPKVRAYSEG